MNGNKSPKQASTTADPVQAPSADNAAADVRQSPVAGKAEPQGTLTGSPKASIEAEDTELPDAPLSTSASGVGEANGEEDANSEAETVLTSPVKKREAERQYSEAVKSEKPEESNPPSLPAPKQEEDDEADAPGSPDDAVATRSTAATAKPPQDNLGHARNNSDRDDSEPLSEITATRSSISGQSSRESSQSRAHSERPDLALNGKDSPNPRKRKHRASSVSLPSKRPSLDAPRRRLRGLHSEEGGDKAAGERSPSPKGRSHRRAVSTQSAFMEGTAETQSGRKRRANTQFPVRDPKAAKTGWDESSVSSETTSHGKGEARRPQRGIGRSTSTPGRPPGREHKRHVNKYGFTKLAEACENNDLEQVKEWLEKDPEQLELAEFAHNTPLQIASLNGNDVIVKFLIDQGCKVDCANVDKDTPLIDAAENGHLRVVEILLAAGVDPLRENRKGQQALDVVDDETDNAAEIKATLREAVEKWNSDDAKQRREAEEEQRYRAGPAKELHFMARTYENLMKLVTNNDRNSVREFLDARVPVDNAIIAAAAKTGDSYLVSMLLAEITEKKAHQKPEKPMLNVLGSSHFEMVKTLSELEYFNPLWKNRQGKTWPEIAAERAGPNWKQEKDLLQRLYNEANRNASRRSSSPVTRRDQGSRRPPLRSGENSDEEATPKHRKNGRRLMSRRDMRAANGKPLSDSSEDDSSEEVTKEAEESMKPPASPGTKRAVGRPRARNTSNQPTEGDAKGRRRSGSLREKLEGGLPSVDEKMEDADADSGIGTSLAKDSAGAQKHALTPDEEKTRAEDEEAKARRAQEEAKKAEETRKAEEELRKEEARGVEKARKLEEQRRKEEARRVEDARRAEEEHKQQEAETKRKHREDLLQSLPAALAVPLGLKTSTPLEDEHFYPQILENFTPLQAISLNTTDEVGSPPELFVLNVQAAPLLGHSGLDLLLPKDAPGFADSLSSSWPAHPLSDEDRHCLRLALPAHCLAHEALSFDPMQVDMDFEDGISFDLELARAAQRISNAYTAQEKLETAPCSLHWVRLRDVAEHFHPALKGTPVPVRVDLQPVAKSVTEKQPGSFEALEACWRQIEKPMIWEDARMVESEVDLTGETEVMVLHEK